MSLVSHLFILFALAASIKAPAAIRQSIDLGMSALSYQMNRQASDPSGKVSPNGINFFHFYFQGNLGLSQATTFSPNLRYAPGSLFTVESPDGASTAALTTLGLPLLWHSSGKAFSLGAGPTLLRYEISGKGGSKVLNNGNSQLTFGLPGRKETSTTAALSLISQFHWKKLMLGCDLLLQGMGSAEKRSYSFSLAVAYGIGG